MKRTILMTTLLLSTQALANEPHPSFELHRQVRPAYRDCTLGMFPSEEAVKVQMLQEAQLKCGTDVNQEAPFSVVRNECKAEKPDIIVFEVTGRFSCKNPTERVTGLGYLVKDGRVGTGLGDVSPIADGDAVGQCGKDVIRVTEYEFARTYYKYGMVRLTASAQYECARP